MVQLRHRLHVTSAATLLMVALAAQLTCGAADQAPVELFKPQLGAKSEPMAIATGTSKADVVGMMLVNSKPGVLARTPGRMSLYLTKKMKVTAVLRPDLVARVPKASMAAAGGATDLYNGQSMWVGEVAGSRGSSSIVAIGSTDGDTTFGVVRWLDHKTGRARKFLISPVRKGKRAGKLTAIVEVRERYQGGRGISAGFNGSGTKPPVKKATALNASTVTSVASAGDGTTGTIDAFSTSKPIIDVLLVATDMAVFAAGDFATLSSWMRLSVAMTNKAYADSGIPARLRIVGIKQVFTEEDASDHGDEGILLNRLRNGFLPHVHDWRTAYGADIVSLYTAFPGHGGLSYINGKVTGRKAYGYSLVLAGSIGPGYTLAYNVGYNLGCGTNAEDRTGAEYSTSALGWRKCKRRPVFISIMSGPCSTVEEYNVAELGQYARPEGRYRGQPTGDRRDGNCAAAIRITAPRLAAFNRRRKTPLESVAYTITLYELVSYGGSSVTFTTTWNPAKQGAASYGIPDLADYGFSNKLSSFKIQITCTNYDCPTAVGESRIVFWTTTSYGDIYDGYDPFGPDEINPNWPEYCPGGGVAPDGGDLCNMDVEFVDTFFEDKIQSFKLYWRNHE